MYDNSTPIGGQVSSVKLIAAINKFPESWALTPCIGKRNLWPGWQKTKLDRAQLIEAIRSQKNHEGKKTAWTGVSVVTGPLSGGLMAVDFDGPLALTKYLELSGDSLPPSTKRWTSGKPGHFQILLQVPPLTKGEELKPQKIELADGQKLELRWNQCSTLPPSIHPDTQQPYFWKNQGEIAECPAFILDLMREAPAAPVEKKLPQSPLYISDEKSLVELLESEILPRLDAEEFYRSYLKLKSAGKNLKALCPFHQEKTASFSISPEEKTFHCFGCGVGGGPVQFLHQIKGGSGSPTGKDFYSVVMELADRVGVRMPDFAKGQNLKSKKPNSQGLHPQPPENNNILTHPKFETRELSGLKIEVCQLLEKNLKRSDLTIAIGTLSQKYGRSTQEIRSLYQELEQELEQESDLEDTRTGIEQLLASKSASVKLSEIFPESLAAPIEVVANRMNLKPEVYALALISGISRFLKNGSSTMLVEEWNRYRCRTLGYFGAFIAEASQMKTPVLNAMIADPLAAMRKANQEKFKAQEKAYKDELEQWKNSKDEDKGPPPDAPVEKLPYITKATWEGISGMVGRDPEQGILWLCDELAGFFKSANQYRSGKGSDKEDLLECWSGNGAVVARAGGTIVNVGAVSLSIYGNIQPKVLAPFLGDGSDDNGTFARFDFVQQPPALTQITLGLPRIDINPMLQALYENVDTLPVMEFELDQEAKELFVDYYNHCQKLRISHPKQGMRAMLGKAAEKVGRVTTILHCIHAAHFGAEVSPKIPASRVRAAIKWVEYTTQQALSINVEVCSPDALESNLTKIISLAERNGGSVTVRDILRTFDSQSRPSPQTIQEWLTSLESMKYGEVTQKGRSIRFSLCESSAFTAFAEKPGGTYVSNAEDSLRTASAFSAFNNQKYKILELNAEERGGNAEESSAFINPYVDKDVASKIKNAVNAEDFTSSAETTPPSMLSCTTEPAKFAEQIRKAIANSDRALAEQISEVLKGKTQENLRNEVKDALAPSEIKNFNLLAKAEFGKTSPPPTAAKFKVGDKVQMCADYITPELCDQQAVVVKDFGDDTYQIDFGRKIKTPFVEPKRFFVIDKKYFHHVTDGEQLEMPF